MGRGIINQLAKYTPGIKLVAAFSRNPENAQTACAGAGIEKVRMVESRAELEAAIRANECAVTGDATLLAEADGIDVLVDATGAVEFGANLAVAAIHNGRHLVMMNAEVDGTVGPILKHYADRAGVILSGSDGDQPGVQLNLYRFVQSIGLTPLVCGNIKG